MLTIKKYNYQQSEWYYEYALNLISVDYIKDIKDIKEIK